MRTGRLPQSQQIGLRPSKTARHKQTIFGNTFQREAILAKTTLYLSALISVATLIQTLPSTAEEAFATRNLNIRSGPGIAFEIVDQLVENEPVDKRNCNPQGSWCYISHDGPGGWVASVFLTDSLTPEPRLEQPVSIPQDSSDYIANTQVNVRTGPGTQFAVIDTLEVNDSVKRGQCSSSGRWCYVDHAGADGWVSNKFLSPVVTTPTPTSNAEPEDEFSPLQYVAKSSVNIRSGPGTNFNVLDRLTEGENITRNQCLPNGTWCYITHAGPDGWVSADFIYPYGEVQSVDTVQPTTSTVTLRTATAIAGIPVRNAPSLLTGTLGRIERGATVTVNKCSSDKYWCHVMSDTAQGWVPAAFLRLNEETTKPTPTSNPTSSERQAITNERVLVREGPGLNFEVVGTVPAGRSIEIDRCNTQGNWCLINSNGRSGWITTSHLKLPQTNAPTVTSPTTPNAICFEGFGGIKICLE